MAKDCVEVVFIGHNVELYSKNICVQELEMVLMCVLNGNILGKDLPIFTQGYCFDIDYVKKFGDYFNVGCLYDVKCHVGLFITALRVRGYDVDAFCERLVITSKNGTKNNNKRGTECLASSYSEKARWLAGNG
jgi:hypothetical protein